LGAEFWLVSDDFQCAEFLFFVVKCFKYLTKGTFPNYIQYLVSIHYAIIGSDLRITMLVGEITSGVYPTFANVVDGFIGADL
jgi:hypothetical protein